MTKLTIAIPSKGRLQDNTHAFFARAGLTIERPGGDRNYRGTLKGFPDVEIAFLSASEIAREIADGSVHMGVTGIDLVEENISAPYEKTHLVTALGFGHADVVIALPTAWIDVSTMADLSDVASDFRGRHGRRLRVATKYVNLTRAFFAKNGIADYRIVESAGATEGAPAAGTAELIVDITSTGSTLKANNLKIPDDGVMLRSQAHLVASLTATWCEEALAAARAILDQVAAEEIARNTKEIRAVLPDPKAAAKRAASEFGCTTPFGDDGSPLVLHCPARDVPACAAMLKALGAAHVNVVTLDYVFETENPLYDPLHEKVS
ncbi:ATP phosphoribosyltransferase [Rhizobiales bacterium]|uniref:ATP phosphoribosyltransferase n=1 Tax=Hongsoonwoonella zoysiae TaxID=2821844 RepID=UPI00156108F2|nr:ATP phosphoribosyltransferase [Hongsoonwoonella zoysiae]NRG19866.1 ATP phosphoribosyltransferase [Hongsoonwoonella zoysiae]